MHHVPCAFYALITGTWRALCRCLSPACSPPDAEEIAEEQNKVPPHQALCELILLSSSRLLPWCTSSRATIRTS